MTKFILIGGFPSSAPDGGQALCQEMVKGLPEPIRILDVLFARPEDRWDESSTSDQHFFSHNLPTKQIEFQVAQRTSLTQQIKWTNIIYLKGGETDRLLHALKENPDWSKHLNGKVVAGTSAGAYVLAKYAHELAGSRIVEGLGLVQVKTASHYESKSYKADWSQVQKDLGAHGEKLPIILQREGEYQVFERDL